MTVYDALVADAMETHDTFTNDIAALRAFDTEFGTHPDARRHLVEAVVAAREEGSKQLRKAKRKQERDRKNNKI